jgi:hypothetical protein
MASGEQRDGLTQRSQSSKRRARGEDGGDARYSLPDFAPGRRLFRSLIWPLWLASCSVT